MAEAQLDGASATDRSDSASKRRKGEGAECPATLPDFGREQRVSRPAQSSDYDPEEEARRKATTVAKGDLEEELEKLGAAFATHLDGLRNELLTTVTEKTGATGKTILKSVQDTMRSFDERATKRLDETDRQVAMLTNRTTRVEQDQLKMWETIAKLQKGLDMAEQAPIRIPRPTDWDRRANPAVARIDREGKVARRQILEAMEKWNKQFGFGEGENRLQPSEEIDNKFSILFAGTIPHRTPPES